MGCNSCGSCGKSLSDLFIQCSECKEKFHYRCTEAFKNSTKEPLKQDTFYSYNCAKCSGSETYTRLQMSWINVTQLCLYNLMKRNPNKQFFRWKEDICAFISEYWDEMWPTKTKSSTWENTVASALSMHQNIFKTGIEVMKQPGWWSLHVVEPPISIPKKPSTRKRTRKPPQKKDNQREKEKILKEKEKMTPIPIEEEWIIEEDEDIVSEYEDEPETENDKMLLTLAKYIATKCDDDSIITSKLENAKRNVSDKDKRRFLEPEEEWELLQKIEKSKPCPVINRLRRKLILRRLKRTMGMKLFNLDSKIRKYVRSNAPIYSFDPNDDDDLMDVIVPYVANPRLSLFCKLHGSQDIYESQISPYTNRTLKPFIYRDFSIEPMKLGVLREIPSKCLEMFPNKQIETTKYPIDYCYFHRRHLYQVNNLLSQFFWPGIDISEALSYPDFSILAMYRKLIVGAAFMTPNGYITYFFVHPDWERAGVGTFMMYHLIQTCQGKDITLHVSASNPAMILYQKFGFKPEQFIVNFYDKYYPANDHRASKNAFFVRLRR